jgi:hypothetical protein
MLVDIYILKIFFGHPVILLFTLSCLKFFVGLILKSLYESYWKTKLPSETTKNLNINGHLLKSERKYKSLLSFQKRSYFMLFSKNLKKNIFFYRRLKIPSQRVKTNWLDLRTKVPSENNCGFGHFFTDKIILRQLKHLIPIIYRFGSAI